MKNKIRKILRECSYIKNNGNIISERKKRIKNKATEKKLERTLTNGLYNQAEFCRRLWGKSGANQRSLFRKKLLNKYPNKFTKGEISKIIQVLSTSYGKVEKINTKKNTEINSLYKRVKQLLANPIYHHAEIARRLWDDDSNSARAMFDQKLNKENGMEFTEKELKQILSILLSNNVMFHDV